MATFRNRHGKWQARVQRKGQQPISKSFQSKEDAQRWARQVEANHTDLFYKQIKVRGRPPSGYTHLDLTDPEQLDLAILRTLPK